MQIRNSIFLVTGGASGLGAASARMAAENGAKVVIADLQAELGEKLAKEIGGRFVRTDVSSEADGKAAVALAVKEFGGLHVLVNCAGIALAERTLGKEAPHDLGRFTQGPDRQRDRHLQHDPPRRRRHGESVAERIGRARRDRQYGVGGGVRRADRAGGLLGVEGRDRRHDAADRARSFAQRHPRVHHRAGHLRDAAARRACRRTRRNRSASRCRSPRASAGRPNSRRW